MKSDLQKAFAVGKIIADLDRLVGDLAANGFYHLADRLEELTGDVEEAALKARADEE